MKSFKFGYVGRCEGYRVQQAFVQGEAFYEEGTPGFNVALYPCVNFEWVLLEVSGYNPTSYNNTEHALYLLRRYSLIDLPKDVVDNMDAMFELRDKSIKKHRAC